MGVRNDLIGGVSGAGNATAPIEQVVDEILQRLSFCPRGRAL